MMNPEETFEECVRRAADQAQAEQLAREQIEEIRLIATRRSFGLQTRPEPKRRPDFLVVIDGGRKD